MCPFAMQKYFKFNYRTYATKIASENLLWLYCICLDGGMFYLGKIENNQYVEPANFRQLDWDIKKGCDRLVKMVMWGQDIWKPVTNTPNSCYLKGMPVRENTRRNRSLVQDRINDPRKWSYTQLGNKYSIDKSTAEDIFKRDIKKYATDKQISVYEEKLKSKV